MCSFQAEPEGFSHFHLYVCAAFLIKWRKEILDEEDFQVNHQQATTFRKGCSVIILLENVFISGKRIEWICTAVFLVCDYRHEITLPRDADIFSECFSKIISTAVKSDFATLSVSKAGSEDFVFKALTPILRRCFPPPPPLIIRFNTAWIRSPMTIVHMELNVGFEIILVQAACVVLCFICFYGCFDLVYLPESIEVGPQ